MSILKRAKEKQIVSFRTQQPLSKNNEELSSEVKKEEALYEENPEFHALIEQRAHEIANLERRTGRPVGRPQRRDRLSVRNRKLTVSISPRQEARWRDCASREQRAMSEWIRMAVESYLRSK